MGNRGSIGELVENERELSRVREGIERLEAEQRALVGKIDLATIHVTLATRSVPVWKTPSAALLGAGKSGLEGAQAVFTYGAIAFLTLAPTLLPLAAIFVGLWIFTRRRHEAQVARAKAAMLAD